MAEQIAIEVEDKWRCQEEKMFRQIGPLEIGLILIILLVVFGAGKLPQVGRALGKSISEFRKSSRGDFDEDEKETGSKAPGEAPENRTK
jgi:sec-independent protein translocase protein TatA